MVYRLRTRRRLCCWLRFATRCSWQPWYPRKDRTALPRNSASARRRRNRPSENNSGVNTVADNSTQTHHVDFRIDVSKTLHLNPPNYTSHSLHTAQTNELRLSSEENLLFVMAWNPSGIYSADLFPRYSPLQQPQQKAKCPHFDIYTRTLSKGLRIRCLIIDALRLGCVYRQTYTKGRQSPASLDLSSLPPPVFTQADSSTNSDMKIIEWVGVYTGLGLEYGLRIFSHDSLNEPSACKLW